MFHHISESCSCLITGLLSCLCYVFKHFLESFVTWSQCILNNTNNKIILCLILSGVKNFFRERPQICKILDKFWKLAWTICTWIFWIWHTETFMGLKSIVIKYQSIYSGSKNSFFFFLFRTATVLYGISYYLSIFKSFIFLNSMTTKCFRVNILKYQNLKYLGSAKACLMVKLGLLSLQEFFNAYRFFMGFLWWALGLSLSLNWG